MEDSVKGKQGEMVGQVDGEKEKRDIERSEPRSRKGHFLKCLIEHSNPLRILKGSLKGF